MLAFEEDKERIPLEREVVRLAGNVCRFFAASNLLAALFG
jgi:hypothetical protein